LRKEPPETTRRYRELADKLSTGTLTPAERQELEALVAASERLSLENARALLRRRKPETYDEALAEEQRAVHRR
jgi:hypothetical protein